MYIAYKTRDGKRNFQGSVSFNQFLLSLIICNDDNLNFYVLFFLTLSIFFRMATDLSG